MPFDYNRTSALNNNPHILILDPEQKFEIQMYEPERRDIVVVDPEIRGNDYNLLSNKPQINGITLVGNLTSQDLGLPSAESYPYEPLSVEDLEALIANEL